MQSSVTGLTSLTSLFIPSPSTGVWRIGPIPLRAYAICIILGIIAGGWLGARRWKARGGRPETVVDVLVWAIPFGIVGARVYHLITDPELYFAPGKHPIDALKIWNGGLGIWGAVALGALGAWIGCRRAKVPFLAIADALAPGIILAQAIGRWGNYFNQELFGSPTTLPWGLKIDLAHRPVGYEQFATFHPTFLYECIWDLLVLALLLWADKRFTLGHGRVLALYAAAYTVGRAWTEYLRIDTANHFLGLRLNDWTCLVLFLAAVGFFLYSRRRWPGRETAEECAGPAVVGDGATETSDSADSSEEKSKDEGEESEDEDSDSGDSDSAADDAEPVTAQPAAAAEKTSSAE